MKSWARGWITAVPLLCAALLCCRPGHAHTEPEDRPHDAPITTARETAPPVPPEYLTHDEGWLRMAYHPSGRERISALAAQANNARKELSEKLGADVLASVEVRIAAVPGEMARLSPKEPPSYASGIALRERSLIVMSLASPLSLEPPKAGELLRHLLAHLALDQALGDQAVPAWFHEGFAVHTAGNDLSLRTQNLCVAATTGRLIPLNKLAGEMPADAPNTSLSYAEAADFVRFLLNADAKSSERFPRLIRAMRDEHKALQPALADTYDTPLPELERAWRRDMAKRYGFLPVMLASTLLWAIALSIYAAKRARQKHLRKGILQGRPARRARPDVQGEIAELQERGFTLSGARPRIPRQTQRASSDVAREAPVLPEPEVPKVKHEGEWHTLH